MKKKIILGTSFIIVVFSVLYFFYTKSNYKKNFIETEKKNLIDKENIKLAEEKIESSNIIEDVSYSAKDAKGNEATRIVMKLHPKLAPIKVAILPLVKKEGLPEIARKLVNELFKGLNLCETFPLTFSE